MPDPGSEARIQDLKRRIDQDPGSRLFVALAEEYRKSGRFGEALSTLQRGMLSHPSYLSAHVALGRAYLEAGQVTEAIATFSKVLVTDPGNLVSAKALADVYMSRGEKLEAVKKYKLYRALSGDRGVDEIVARLEKDLAPPPPPAKLGTAASAPPPPSFGGPAASPAPEAKPAQPPSPSRPRPSEGPFDLSVPSFGGIELAAPTSEGEPFPAAPPAPEAAPGRPGETAPTDAVTRALRVPDLPVPRPTPPPSRPREEEPEGQGRTLADLYFAQGQYSEALRIYDELVALNPFDEELRRLRRDSEARLLPAATAGPISGDAAFEKRLKKIRALKQWLSVLQAG
jgi:tetratricopeptide (TPR) repeat protein